MINMPTPQQAPGQAMMPGMAGGITSMLPQPGRGGTQAGVQALTPALSQMDKQQLLMEFMNPGSQIPKFAVLSALDQKAKQERAMQAVQGTMAQQQAQQQPGTVAQEVLQGATQIARHGGAMHSYSGGGIVAFANGGNERIQKILQRGVSRRDLEAALKANFTLDDIERSLDSTGSFSLASTSPVTSVISSPEEQVVPVEVPLPQRQVQSEAVKQELIPGASLARAVSRVVSGERPDFYKTEFSASPDFMKDLEPSRQPLPQTPLPPEYVSAPQRLMDTRAVPAPRANVTNKVRTAPVLPPGQNVASTTGLASLDIKDIPEAKTALEKVAAAAGLTPEQQKMLEEKQAAEMQARRSAETGRSKRAEDERARATRVYEEALSGQQGIFGPRGLLEIAASIDPRKGYVFGSLARGAAGVLAREEKAKKEAKTEYDRAQQLYSQELNALDTIRLATAERDTAILSGNIAVARDAEVKRAQATKDYEQLRYSRAAAERTAAIQASEAESKRTSAQAAATSAAKPTEMQFAAENPEQYAAIQRARADAVSAGRGVAERQDLAELRALIASLRDQADPMKNFDKPSRDEASRLLKQAQARLAEMSGLPPPGGSPATSGEVDKNNPLLK